MRQLGLTLIELMIVIAITAILVAMTVPAFSDFLLTQRARGGAESLVAALQNTKSQAIKTNQVTRIVFQPSGTGVEHANTAWCYGMTDIGAVTCDCSVSPSDCVAGSIVDGDDFSNVTVRFNASQERRFDPVLGDANGSQGTVIFNAGNNKEVGVTLSRIGRIVICQPANSTISRYEDNVCQSVP